MVKVEFTKKHLYFLAGFVVIIGLGFVLATIPNPGHSFSQIETCGANKILKMDSSGSAWTCGNDDVGITSETDPEVGTINDGKWCVGVGTQVVCTQNAPSADWATMTGKPTFASDIVSGRVKATNLGCGTGWASSCDSNSDGKIDSAASADSATTATNSLQLNGKTESQLSVSYATSAGSAGSATTATTASNIAAGTYNWNSDSTRTLNADYATSAGSAGSADSVPWSGVTGKPTVYSGLSCHDVSTPLTELYPQYCSASVGCDYGTPIGGGTICSGYVMMSAPNPTDSSKWWGGCASPAGCSGEKVTIRCCVFS
jgi:hypothetical protein